MLYDIINFFDAIIVAISITLWSDILSINRRKVFIPPFARRWKIISTYSFLAVSCFSFGCTLHGIINNEHSTMYTMATRLLGYAIWLFGTYYSWMLTKEKTITMTIEEKT